MSRVALLMGVSRYPPGLNLLPRVPKDLEAMRRALKQAEPGFEPVDCYSDRPIQEMQERIEAFFQDRHPEDQIVFLFCGYLILDTDAALYFATPDTQIDPQGRLLKSRAIPARFVQDVMNRCPARQQILILSGPMRQMFHSQTATGDNPINLQTQLGGEGRIILAATATTQPSAEPEDLDVWGYTRYLAEGIETAAADANSNGSITVDEWHNYARRKLATAAPAAQPELFGSMETARQFTLPVPVHDVRVSYRKMLEEMVERGEVDATGSMLLTRRPLLDDIRYTLGISPQDAATIETQALRPVQDYRQRLQTYQEQVSGIDQSQGVVNPQLREHLYRLQTALGLRDSDTAAIDAAPRMAEQQKQHDQYQKRLAQYGSVLGITLQKQFPLTDSDRQTLQKLQQVLQLKDEDVNGLETQLVEQINRQITSTPPTSEPIDQTSSTSATAPPIDQANPAATTPPPIERAGSAPTTPPPAPATPVHPPLTSFASPSPLPQPAPNLTPNPFEANLAQPAAPVPADSPPGADANATPTDSKMTTTTAKDNKTQRYSALVIPGVMLAALLGSLVALWSSASLPNLFSRTTTASRNTTIAPNSTAGSLNQAADLIRLGIDSHEKARDFDNAVKYATEAINLLSKDCPNPGSKSPSCSYLARAYSNRSYAYFAQQNFGKALNDARQATELDSSLAEARVNLANARFKQRDLAAALNDYNQALNLKSANQTVRAGALNNRGNVLLAQRKPEEAIKDYTQAIKLKPSYADAFFNRGLAQEELKQTTKAANDYRSAAQYYRNQGAFTLADQAQRKADALQNNPPQSPAPTQSAAPASAETTPKG